MPVIQGGILLFLVGHPEYDGSERSQSHQFVSDVPPVSESELPSGLPAGSILREWKIK